ncbi:MAG TPA: HlyD family secretion protein [Polyangiaceae bacterium]|nr:HlyD family secretion protein [Polyangiaceae bacterium]
MATTSHPTTALLSSADEAPAAPAPVTKPRRRALVVLPVLTAIALGGGTLAWASQRGVESTDDAQVEGHVVNVAARVSGQVKSVLVRDNQRVHAGDVLVELDPADLAAKLAAARADVAAAKAQLRATETGLAVTMKSVDSNLAVAKGGLVQASAVRGTTRAAIDQARADLDAAKSRRALAETEFRRSEGLLESGAVARADYDLHKSALEQADAAVTLATARLVSAETNLDNAAGTIQAARGHLIAAESGPAQVDAAEAQVELARAKVDQATAALEQAELNVSYTKVRAETSGVVSRRSVEPGQTVSPERPLLAIVNTDDTWIVANFKEDQIAEMKPGEPAKISVDTFSGRPLAGKVESLAGGTGARFALLPPDNASGNFTKVVQRVPVLIQLEPHPGVELRPGMSATVKVSTR